MPRERKSLWKFSVLLCLGNGYQAQIWIYAVETHSDSLGLGYSDKHRYQMMMCLDLQRGRRWFAMLLDPPYPVVGGNRLNAKVK